MADESKQAGHTVSMTAYHRTTEALERAKRARKRVILPAQCARCGRIINEGDLFDMGHTTDVAAGGHDSELRPEHRRCNRRAGGRIANHAKQTRAERRRPKAPSW